MKLTNYLNKLAKNTDEALTKHNPALYLECHIRMSALMDIFEPEELCAMLGDDSETFAMLSLKMMITPLSEIKKWVGESEEL